MKIPLIITNDFEVAHDHDYYEQKDTLCRLLTDFERINLPCTFFSTLDALRFFKNELKIFKKEKIEIGCHGINHDREENYKFLDYDTIESNLKLFDGYAKNEFSIKPTTFRGPFMSTSVLTQKALINNGYTTDYSVCPQRFDFFNSKGGSVRWLFSPRHPYRPHVSSPFRKGEEDIFVVPMSCFIVPFNSGSLYLFGLRFMKTFFRTLFRETAKCSKPIVYQFHSYEFSRYAGNGSDNVSYVHRFYRQDREERYKANLELIKFMLSFGDRIVPLKASGIIDYGDLRNL